MKHHEPSSLELAASCLVNKDIQAEGDRANDDTQRMYRKSRSVTAEASRCNVATHINLLPGNIF